MTNETAGFGCEQCWPEAADVAWNAVRSLSRDARLIDESHFSVTLRSCLLCGQGFVDVFTEQIDWSGGNDPQFHSVLPITPEETNTLRQQGAELSERELNALPARRCLRRDWPSSGPTSVYWGNGLLVGPHD